MMGRCPDGGCGTDERPCRLNSRVPATQQLTTKKQKRTSFPVDFFSQARKALSERCPFDVPEDGSGSGAGLGHGSSATTLPSGLASLLKQSDNSSGSSRKRHKKSHFGSDKKKSGRASDRFSKGRNIWVETEDYFKELGLPDIDALFELSSYSLGSLDASKCFLVKNERDDDDNVIVYCENGDAHECENENLVNRENGNECENEVARKQEEEQFMEIDSFGGESNDAECRDGLAQSETECMQLEEANACPNSGFSTGLEWLLGCRTRTVLTSERPSKKRKLLGRDAGLEKVLVGSPCLGNISTCDFCCKGELGDESNQLIVCASCKAAVHLNCYGVQGPEDESWLCSWCKHRKSVGDDSVKQSCVLCPKQGGALKPVGGESNGSVVEFAHLFCSLWTPEVYVEDIRKMEKIMDVQEIKEARRKLVCNVCKVKSGVCVRCSHGTCRAAFHPICAREARNRMEVWGKYGSENVELRAFCSKHSGLTEKLHKPRIGRNGDKLAVHVETHDSISDKSGDTESQEIGVCDSRTSDVLLSESAAGEQVGDVGMHERSDDKEEANMFDSLDGALILKKLIDRGKVNTKDIALEIGVSLDSLLSSLDEDTYVPDLQCKIVRWLRNHAYMGSSLKSWRVKLNSTILSKDEMETIDRSDNVTLSESDITNHVAVKSVPPRRRTKSNIRLLRDNKSSQELLSNCAILEDETKVDKPVPEEQENSTEESAKISMYSDGIKESLHEELFKSEGLRIGETCHLEASSNANLYCDHQNNVDCESAEINLDQLVLMKKLGICENSPADEVEGELIYFQQKLLRNTTSRKQYTDNLICKVAKSLPNEIDMARVRSWDAILVNQYLSEVREAKKQGRKERKHKEAQAVLAAATAAAAASSRISSFRKDIYDGSIHQEKLNISNGRAAISSQLMPRPKETVSRVAVPRNSSEKYSDFVQSFSDFSKEHPRSCDICRRSETLLNPILVCSSCKVAVHLDCYRSVKESKGPWYCELCENLLSSKCSATASLNFWEKPYFVAECGLCGGTTGAFRKSADGQWVHAFCAEWVFEPTFRRGQVNPVEGMEKVAKGMDICSICRRKHGVCIKCSYGHCQTTFHPSCARSAGFYMNVKSLHGRLQHKAYCERHGLEQRAKAETQKHGVEELKSMKQVRVELEKLRLLCERIIKREKLKRDLVLCSHGILACKRDHVAQSVLVHSPFFPPEVSSESATTSLKGNTDGYRSCSDAMQRSDDVTVDSSLSVKHRIKVTMDADQRTDDRSTSQNPFNQKSLERVSFGGKQIPHRASLALRSSLDEGEWSAQSRKRFETFEKELVMTSDQASMKNQQLPKGYFYIPVDCLPKEKHQDSCPGDPVDHKR